MPNEVKDPKMLPALELMLADEIAGDPMTDQRWVRSSLRNLSKNLKEKGHEACTHTVARMLRKTGYALQANRKKQVRAPHPDRDQQFKYIAELKKKFLLKGLPVISIDTKKKELIGNYRREGKSWRKEPIEVDSYFASYAQCVAVPFGIYDLGKNIGYVSVGISSNTAEFAVNSLVWWWQRYARSAYPSCDRILILADGGGGNGYKESATAQIYIFRGGQRDLGQSEGVKAHDDSTCAKRCESMVSQDARMGLSLHRFSGASPIANYCIAIELQDYVNRLQEHWRAAHSR
jgi:hypothetical protein